MRLSRLVPVTAGALGLVLAGCGDDPFQLDWVASPDTVLLYSLARPELNLPSAFNFNERRFVRIESPGATGAWDFALDSEEGGLVFLVPGALGIRSRARITSVQGIAFPDVREAPADTAAYISDRPVPVEQGPIFIFQTVESVGAFGTPCVFYAKLEVLDVDVELGTMLYVYDSNPVCNDRDLVPPDR
ncbi:MAG: hypothetical protein RQ751_09520 [Longimicrobiales bacterium]|nr:hypothetical protein [Longimicrobiales bacterium]